MSEKLINLRKGLQIRMEGVADKSLMTSAFMIEHYAVKPTDFYGLIPKLLVAVGDHVKAGTPLFYDKNNEQVKIPSPVSGEVVDIVRGEQRRIEEIKIKVTPEMDYLSYEKTDVGQATAKEIIAKLLDSGLWAYVRQRPYNCIANPEDAPKAIVVSGFDSAPMAPDYDFVLHGLKPYFQVGLDALAKLTKGKLHLNLHVEHSYSEILRDAKNVEINYFKGKHPVGNVGVQIHHLDPINKGEVVWHVNPQDVVIIGRFLLEGKYDATKIIALAGSELKRGGYYKIVSGADVSKLVSENLQDEDQTREKTAVRVISGNVLTGTKIGAEGYLGFYDHMVSVIAEGNYAEPFGWVLPGFKKFSLSRTFFSWIFQNKEYKLDTNFHGGHRAYVVTGQFEKVFPMNIYPLQLIKACVTKNIDDMEKLGIYEVDPEDFALCEYVDTSKTDIQQIIREGLDLVRKEA